MNNFRIFILTFLIIGLSACKITGEAQDQADREELEPKLDLGKINVLKSKTKKENEELRARLERLENAQRSGGTPVYQQPSRPGDITAPPIGGGNSISTQRPATGLAPIAITPENSANFDEWKKARNNSSNDYKEFKEYQEWLEFKKLKDQKK